MEDYPKSNACIHHEVIAKAIEEDKIKEMKYYFEKYKELEIKPTLEVPKSTGSVAYTEEEMIQRQLSSYRNEIADLKDEIKALQDQLLNQKRDSIKSDIERIMDGKVFPNYILDDIVEYILDREVDNA